MGVLLVKQLTPAIQAEIDYCRKELESIAAYEETLWQQRSKDLWLREGDRNTGDVYVYSRPLIEDIAKWTEFLPHIVDASMVEDLLHPYTTLEVSKALSQMAPQKSPGPDDDTLLFCQASPECTMAIKGVLEVHRRASGQEINFSKSWVTFSCNTREDLGRFIAAELAIRQENKMELYLGLPPDTGFPETASLQPCDVGQAVVVYPKAAGETPKSRSLDMDGGVGSGDTIRAWGDLWLPRPRSFKPITPVPVGGGSIHVAKLIDSDSRECDASMVHEFFWPVDSELILGIPLGRMREEDLWVWHYSKSGMFFVRTAYHLACELEDRPCSSTLGTLDHWWCRSYGRHHSLISPGVCPFCQDAIEDIFHVLAQCEFARVVWGLSFFTSLVMTVKSRDARCWLQEISSHLSGRDFGLSLCICWPIWWGRNVRVMEGVCFEPGKVVGVAVHYLNAFLVQKGSVTTAPSISISSRSLAPPPDVTKLNFDEATFDQDGEMGVGVVARNDLGQCVGWLSR
ncbi:hypothetical protein Sango_2986000 [Sesamum angolense]|uniref:Reverse transcriptase zinc-binding domain-containing protein n=1 Tax=Sesamum angolense TaxID=2727404 RepID=A0AAE1T4W7_9LAMI|nr:hypothetical protein Sango_2986000 [Sesamum angolense]